MAPVVEATTTTTTNAFNGVISIISVYYTAVAGRQVAGEKMGLGWGCTVWNGLGAPVAVRRRWRAAAAGSEPGDHNLIPGSARVFGCTRYVCMCTENPENSGLTLRITKFLQ